MCLVDRPLAKPPADMPLILRAHPFSADPGIVMARPGQTIGQMLRAAVGEGRDLAPLEVRVGGHVVPAELWDRLRPKQGTTIEVTGLPQGNMNANWRAVLMIVVTIVVFAYTGYLDTGSWALTSSQWATVAMMGASLAINALVKPPTPLSQDGPKQWNQLTGNSNQINPGGPIPHILGGVRFFPPHAAMPYAVATGGHSYQYCLFDLGYNVEPDDVDMAGATIGDTLLSAYEGVTWQLGTNPSLYRNDTAQTTVAVEMKFDDVVTRTTAPGTETISLDFFAPQGIYGINDVGDTKFGIDIWWDVHYRQVGTTTWLQPPNPRLANLRAEYSTLGMYNKWFLWYDDPLTFGVAWDVPAGQYEVRVRRRDGGDEGNNTFVNQVYWSSLLSVRNVPASRTDTLKLAMRIRSDNQLNGTLQSFSVDVDPKYPVYNESTGTWSRQRTTRAGWIYHYLLTTCPASKKRVPASRMHLDQVLDFVDYNVRHDMHCRMVVDTASTVGQVADMILRTSGGERTMTDGKYGVTFVPDSPPLEAVTYAPTEVADFALQRRFARIPHALRMKFRNPLANWQPDEIIVLDDGYSYRGVDARGNPSSAPEPELFETMDLQATMEPRQAWQLGRMYFAQGKFSPGTYTWKSDVAALKCTKGTPVTLQSNLTQWGVGAGRIVSLTPGGPTGVATLVLDAEVETEPGQSYRMQIRGPGGTQAVNCTPHSPRTATFYLATMPTGVQPGDVGIVGDTTIATPTLLVTHMSANSKLEFTVSATAWDERAAPFWANPPDDFVSEVTGQPYTEPPDPPQLVVGGGENTDDAGIRTPVIRVAPPRERGGRHLPVPEELLA